MLISRASLRPVCLRCLSPLNVCMFGCVFVFVSVRLSLSVCLSVCLYVYLSVYLSVRLLCIFLFISSSFWLSVCLTISAVCLSVRLSACLSISFLSLYVSLWVCLSVHLPICPLSAYLSAVCYTFSPHSPYIFCVFLVNWLKIFYQITLIMTVTQTLCVRALMCLCVCCVCVFRCLSSHLSSSSSPYDELKLCYQNC